jgi:AGZA family xanthine/uracil permease-like MFS transporter
MEEKFLFRERNTDFVKESRAALATFFTVSYILLVNPQLLSKLGLSADSIVVSTALASAISCFLTGFFGNLPLGLAPGVGLSTYLTFGMVFGDGLTIKEAFTSVFIAGAILWIFSVTRVSEILMTLIPRSVKTGTIVGMGLQIALVGMTSVKMVVANSETIVGLGDISNYQVWLPLVGLILTGSLLFHQIEGGILIGIGVMTLLTWVIESSYPSSWVQFPNIFIDVTQFLSVSDIRLVKCLPGIAAFTFIGLIDVSGVIYGMAKSADLVEADGSVPGSQATFSAVALGTMISAATGGTPIIVYVESAVGIKEGGRTGVTAILVGLLFIITLPIAPLLGSIPVTATAPVAMLIGAMMMSQALEVDWHNMSEAIPAFLTMVIMPFTFSITDGIVFGLIAALGFYITTGQMYRDIMDMYFGGQRIRSTSGSDKVGSGVEAVSEMTRLSSSSNHLTDGSYTSGHQHHHHHYPGVTALLNRSMSHHSEIDHEEVVSFIDHQKFERQPSLILKRKSSHG